MSKNNIELKINNKIKIAQKVCLELLIIIDNICKLYDLTYWIDGGTLLGAYRHKGFIPWDDDVDICVPLKDYHVLIDQLKDYCKTNPYKIIFYSDSEFRYWHECFGDIRYLIDGALPIKIDIIPVKYIENNEESIKEDKSLVNIATYYIQGKFKNSESVLAKHKKYLPKGQNLVKEKNDLFDKFTTVFYDKENKNNYLVKYLYNDACVNKDRPYLESNVIYPTSKIIFEENLFNCPADIHTYLVMLYGKSYMDLPPAKFRKPHFKTIITNQRVNKIKLKEFIYLLHHHGFINLALGYRNKHFKILFRITSYFKILICKKINIFMNDKDFLKCF